MVFYLKKLYINVSSTVINFMFSKEGLQAISKHYQWLMVPAKGVDVTNSDGCANFLSIRGFVRLFLQQTLTDAIMR